MFWYYDSTYILIVIGSLLMLLAQTKVHRAYAKYSVISNRAGLTGEQVARQILNQNGIYDVDIEMVQGQLSDHYDPTHKVVRLSRDIYNGSTVASLAVAAHECGHVIQHATGYSFLKFRNAVLPLANVGSSIGWFAIMIGFLFSNQNIVMIGILCLGFMLLFQILTLPVEFDASKRAMKILQSNQYLVGQETQMAGQMLTACALTYIASVAATVLSLLRLFILSSNNDN